VTTPFAEEMKNNTSYDSVYLTGHSLGGGLAIISGAQAGVPAVALSGPNAMISGRSFVPQVTPEQLNRFTFNIGKSKVLQSAAGPSPVVSYLTATGIVPDRDLVARFDDLADQYQRIRCTAPKNAFFECHDFTRSLCEIIYTCGTGDRPAICECHTRFGYPKPITDGDRKFEEACSER
jgi:lipase ATG15